MVRNTRYMVRSKWSGQLKYMVTTRLCMLFDTVTDRSKLKLSITVQRCRAMHLNQHKTPTHSSEWYRRTTSIMLKCFLPRIQETPFASPLLHLGVPLCCPHSVASSAYHSWSRACHSRCSAPGPPLITKQEEFHERSKVTVVICFQVMTRALR